MAAVRLLLVLLVALVLPRSARATVYNNRVCVDVTISFADDDWGTRWTDDTLDKPGRGFWVKVEHGSSPPVQDWPPVGTDHYVATGGTYAGCTDDIAFDSTVSYTITVRSEALVDDVTLVALDDSNPAVKAESVTSGYSPTSDTDVGVVVNGSDARWNLLALDAYALALHNPTSGALTWELRMRACPGGSGSCASEGNAVVNYAPAHQHDKFVGAHELGHLVSYAVDAGGYGCDSNEGASEDGCDGSGVAEGGHGFLTKEYPGAAGCEALADFFAAIMMNALTDPCELSDGTLDFNLDGTDDVAANVGFPCEGDPFSGNPDPVTDGDWLEDLVWADDDDTDGVQCQGGLTHRSSEYDWVRYLWGMVTTEGVPLTDLWVIVDAADPHDWGTSGAWANERMETAADGEGYGAEHDNQKIHGLDH